MNPLRIVFMGTPEFAVPSLEALLQNDYHIVAVITAPDRPQGRGLKLTPSPVKEIALKHHIPVLQPTNLKAPEFLEQLKSLNANLQVVVAFRMLPEVVWAMPALGTFNLHASLLPQYRGAAPINWAIIRGEKETGVTTFFLQHAIDTGAIIFQQKETISDTDDAGTLYDRLMHKGAALVLQTVQAIEAGNYPAVPQQIPPTLQHAPKIFKETCEINWQQPSTVVRDFIRGLSPYPAAWTILAGKTFKIFKTEITSGPAEESPGHYKTDNKTYLHVRTADGWLSVEELQAEGKRKMNIADFFRGNHL
jgi:methionyl-tRNA formyltransferase